MIISFAGHSHFPYNTSIKETVKNQIRSNINSAEDVTCYLGGYGAFDDLCAHACIELKREFPFIEVVYVTPYIGIAEQAKIKELLKSGLYDSSIYPPIEKTPPRFAISKRNEWMMTNADLVIVYVNRSYGGAYKSLQIASRRGKKIINICDIIPQGTTS